MCKYCNTVNTVHPDITPWPNIIRAEGQRPALQVQPLNNKGDIRSPLNLPAYDSVLCRTSIMADVHHCKPPDRGKIRWRCSTMLHRNSCKRVHSPLLASLRASMPLCLFDPTMLNLFGRPVLGCSSPTHLNMFRHSLIITFWLLFSIFCVSPVHSLPTDAQTLGALPDFRVLVTYETFGKLFVKIDTISVDYIVPITEIESAIDFLSLKVATMKYATDLEKLKPLTLKSGDLTYTVFQTPLPLHLASTVCANFRLSPMSITDVPRHFKVPFSVFSLIYQFEILIVNGRLTCLSPNQILPEQQCLDTL